jgi:hypothetical protein
MTSGKNQVASQIPCAIIPSYKIMAIDTPKITVKHNDTTIVYLEDTNNWLYTKGNRERTAPSLAEAKRIIDIPAKEDKSAFKRTEAWVWNSGTYQRGMVTSQAYCRYSDNRYWVSIASVQRRFQASAHEIFPCNEQNDRLISQWCDLSKERDRLSVEMEKRKTKMTHL